MSQTKRILSIDTAMAVCAAGFYDRARDLRISKIEPMQHGHAERLMPLVQEVLAEADATFADLEAIVVTRGPGSFAGLRVGMAAARALALSLSISVYGVTSFQALAFRHNAQEPFGVIIETRRDDFFAQRFDAKGQPQAEPVCGNAQAIREYLENTRVLIGDAAQRYTETLPNQDVVMGGNIMHGDPVLNAYSFVSSSNLFEGDPEPMYLRAADVTLSKKTQRKISV